MMVPAATSISLILSSQPPGSTCNWEVGELDHDYMGYRASHRCSCSSRTYTGPACRECTRSEYVLADGGVSTSTRCLQKDMGGCSSASGLAPWLAVIVLFVLGRRRVRRIPRWAVQ
jgi:uncharacterized protein (TIGR03382 family)